MRALLEASWGGGFCCGFHYRLAESRARCCCACCVLKLSFEGGGWGEGGELLIMGYTRLNQPGDEIRDAGSYSQPQFCSPCRTAELARRYESMGSILCESSSLTSVYSVLYSSGEEAIALNVCSTCIICIGLKPAFQCLTHSHSVLHVPHTASMHSPYSAGCMQRYSVLACIPS